MVLATVPLSAPGMLHTRQRRAASGRGESRTATSQPLLLLVEAGEKRCGRRTVSNRSPASSTHSSPVRAATFSLMRENTDECEPAALM